LYCFLSKLLNTFLRGRYLYHKIKDSRKPRSALSSYTFLIVSRLTEPRAILVHNFVIALNSQVTLYAQNFTVNDEKRSRLVRYFRPIFFDGKGRAVFLHMTLATDFFLRPIVICDRLFSHGLGMRFCGAVTILALHV
jgi:hypothetical protein